MDLTKPIPKLISYYYRTSNLLFLGCSLNHDRTMQVFQAVNAQLQNKDIYRKEHFSLESMPENKDELVERNNYLLNFGITAIWFPKDSYDYIEQILRLARNELRYRGYDPGNKIVNTQKEPIILPKRSSLTKRLKSMFHFNKRLT
jgi:SIR2-like domain